MTDNEEEAYEEEAEIVRPPLRNYEVVMKAINPKDREVFRYFGLLGLNPGFVLLQSAEGFMQFAAEWNSVYCVRVVPDAAVVSMVTH